MYVFNIRYEFSIKIRALVKIDHVIFIYVTAPHSRVVTRMDTPKPGWTPYVVYTTEISTFLHNRNIISNGKRSLKKNYVISVRLERGSNAS